MHPLLGQCEGFDWDDENLVKSEDKHEVTWLECEQAFFNKPLIISDDLAHGDDDEDRFLALGRTVLNRKLFIVFTIRKKRIRVISARNMKKPERAHYEAHR